MQNKGAIRLFAILLAITCLFYLSFTYVTRNVEENARVEAANYLGKPSVKKFVADKAGSNKDLEKYLNDSLFKAREKRYLDSLKKRPVYDILITSFTYEDCKEKEINLGLDLRGGMNVTLEISVPDIIRNMSGKPDDPKLKEALKNAQVMQRTDQRPFAVLFRDALKKIDPNASLASYFRTIELKGKVDYNTKDDDVIKLLNNRVDEAIATSEKTLRARIDKFGVTQPNIQALKTSGRILIELPGVTDKERVEKLLQGTANLEFWNTYEFNEIAQNVIDADKKINQVFGEKKDSTAVKKDSLLTAKGDTSKAIAKKDTTKKKSQLEELLAKKEDTSKAKKGDTSKVAKKDSLNKKQQVNIFFGKVFFPNAGEGNRPMPGPNIGFVPTKDTATVMLYLNNPEVKRTFPENLRFLWSFKPTKRKFEGILKDEPMQELIAIKVTDRSGKAALSGDIITDASKQYEQRRGGTPHIEMEMTSEAGSIWARITKDAASQNPKRCVAVVLDNFVYSYPTVQQEISGGHSQITGDFTSKEADDLVNILKAGKLPAPAKIVQEENVGPTLGKDNINAGFLSFVIALIVVLLFMAAYYNKAGWVANFALLANMFFIVGVLASLSAVLTLPGVAGIVLVIAMSVDANILIFERIREELREGKGIQLAVRDGYKHAMSSIIDSNVTTLLLGIILYSYGTGPVQGFATTLIIGILCSLFAAIFITRLIFERLLAKNKPITLGNKATENAFKNIKIDFVGRRKLYYLFSSAIIITGVIFYMKHGGFSLGVDFKGGRSYVVRFENNVNTEKVSEALKASFEGQKPEVKTYGTDNQVKITTAYHIDDNSEDAEKFVETKLKDGLGKVPNNKYDIVQSQKVGETISRDIKVNAFWTILFSCLVMFLYILIRFKKWQYGLGATVALFHDVFVVLSCYAIFDGLLPFSLEIGQDFIAAVLTVMGYSMTDTVVVFDRIREYLATSNKKDLERGEEKNRIINYALNATLSRTMITSLTTFFVLLVIFIFGGETIRGFSFALLIGIVIGTYSSLCIATPIVIDLDKKAKTVGAQAGQAVKA